jgi:hypothetical protein
MDKKHMKKCSPSLAIKEVQIKTKLECHLTPARMATIKSTTATNVGNDARNRKSHSLLVGM